MTSVPTSPDPATGSRHEPQGGPPLLAPGLAFVALTLAGVACAAGGPRPGTPAADVAAYDVAHPTLAGLAAMLLFGSALPLAIWAATAYRRLWRLGVTAPGTAIAFAGGLLAAGSAAVSGLASWAGAQVADTAAPGAARALTTLAFATGAAGFTVPLALLMAGVSVPGLILGLLPRPVAWGGLVLAGIGMLTTLTLVMPVLDPLLPVVRFGGLLWLVSVSVLLPRTRPRRTAGRRVPAAAAS